MPLDEPTGGNKTNGWKRRAQACRKRCIPPWRCATVTIDPHKEIRATNITRHEGHVSYAERCDQLKQKGCTLWFTGLSGSGKSTTAFTLEHALVQLGHLAYVLDGDNIRGGLNKNLGFSAADREENIRRIGEVAKLFADCGVITMTSFISPYPKDREAVRALHAADHLPFIEVRAKSRMATCEPRDRKELCTEARAGELNYFNGIHGT